MFIHIQLYCMYEHLWRGVIFCTIIFIV